MGSLHIVDEEARRSWRVWPHAEVIPPGMVTEAKSYLFALSAMDGAAGAELLIDDERLEPLRSADPLSARWRWSTEFNAGIVEAELRLPGAKVRRFEIVTDPDRRKLTREDFDVMLREILEDTFELFSLGGFRRAVARGTGAKPPAIARLEFLRSRIEELDKVTTRIARNARQRLQGEQVVVPHHMAKLASGREILQSLRSGRVLRQERSSSRMPPALNGLFPARIRLHRKLHTSDLPEHRQMGECMRNWAAWLGRVGEQLDARVEAGRDPAAFKWARRCRRMSRRISQMCEAAPFGHGSPQRQGLTLTPLFRSDPDYARFYALWQDMNRGIAAVFGDFLNMPLALTWKLYELWCFLRLVRAAVATYGESGTGVGELFIRDAEGGLTIASGAVTVEVGNGWKLCFQKQYREFWFEVDRRGSFSRAMAPDIVAISDVTEVKPGCLIVLDAKYRIEEGLNQALSSIHTYRDALVEETGAGGTASIVSAAYLLTPHIPLGAAAASYRTEPMPARLFRPDYRSSFRFGAVTLRPGLSLTELGSVLRTIVADATATA